MIHGAQGSKYYVCAESSLLYSSLKSEQEDKSESKAIWTERFLAISFMFRDMKNAWDKLII